jgi:ribosomal protein L11 methyltransferase
VAKLGVARVIAVDTDPLAREAAGANAAANGVGDAITVGASIADVEGQQFPLVLANLQAHVLRELEPALFAATQAGGLLIASGLLASEIPLGGAYARRWTVCGRRPIDEWVSLVLRRSP